MNEVLALPRPTLFQSVGSASYWAAPNQLLAGPGSRWTFQTPRLFPGVLRPGRMGWHGFSRETA